jgi:hypothetical protein
MGAGWAREIERRVEGGDFGETCRDCARVDDRRSPHIESDVARGAGAPIRQPARRDQHGVGYCLIGPETSPTLFGARRSEYFHFCVSQKKQTISC